MDGERLRVTPNKSASTVRDYLRCYSMLERHGILPIAGGMLDQSSAFIEAVEIIDSERGA